MPRPALALLPLLTTVTLTTTAAAQPPATPGAQPPAPPAAEGATPGPAPTAPARPTTPPPADRRSPGRGDPPAMQQNVVVLNRAGHPIDRVEAEPDDGVHETTLHGFRLGYGVWLGYDDPEEGGGPETSPKERLGLNSPHHFLIGYELAERMPAGNDALNILLVGNLMIGGLEQSKFLPNLNLLLGFELQRALQVGVGVNLAPVENKPAHMVLAAGWTPRSGDLYLPVHAFFVPDVDGHHRMGLTFGVNWDT